MDPTDNPNRLIVEGIDDRHCVVGLMQHHIPWPDDPENWPVYIAVGKSVDQILNRVYLRPQLKRPNLRSLGVMLDADTKPEGRYQSWRDICLEYFPQLPDEMPSDGLVLTNTNGLRFGVWIMPDNRSVGDLETFLRQSVPEEAEPLWKHAEKSVDSARGIGAPCREPHLAKGKPYTWLAWQDPPGQSPGISLTKKALDPHCPTSAVFAAWFQRLFV